MSQTQTHARRLDPNPGAAVYSRRLLGIYDPFVLGFSNSYLWRCPTPELLSWYDRHVSPRHLDIGVGTGYFLDHCRFPSASPTVALLDLNVESLRFTEERIRRYRPTSYQGNILEPVAIDLAPFESIGMNYLIHCLPGELQTKARVFDHVRTLLAPGGVIFGSTILSEGVERSLPARALMALYNRRGIFGNRHDTLAGLRAAVSSFGEVDIMVRGCVALFALRA